MENKEILDFLNGLKKNNVKEWMDQNKPTYQKCRKAVIEIVDNQIKEIAKWEPGLENLTAKDCIFRINRDIRFSKDKRPYKEHFGAFIAQGGRHTEFAGYYIHIEPKNTFIGGGIYMPPSEILKKIRQEIDYNATELHEIIGNKTFKETYGEIQGERLKTAPKGYPKDHSEIDLLRLKSFVVTHSFTDKEVMRDDFEERVTEIFDVLRPFNQFLDMAVKHEEESSGLEI